MRQRAGRRSIQPRPSASLPLRALAAGLLQQAGGSSRTTACGPFPTTYVLDGDGVIRYRAVRGEAMDRAVDVLRKEVEAKKKERAATPGRRTTSLRRFPKTANGVRTAA